MIWPFRQREASKSMSPAGHADSTIQQIERLLFPPFEVHHTNDGAEICVDRSVDTNLYAALVDLEEGIVDEIVLKSIKDSIDVLTQVRHLLNVKQQLVTDPELLVVAPPVK